jgi:hypothetical protein
VSAVPGLVPRPVAALRVGITGARKLEDAALAGLRDQLAVVLGRIRTLAAASAGGPRGATIYASEAPLLRLLSPLAEGADRLAAEAGLALGYRLEALLPFAREEYERDFPGSLEAFRGLLEQAGPRVLALDGARGADETRSYEAAGRMVVRNCDLLIAIWDGGKSRGRGGSAEIVRFAARHGQPVWWLHADGAGEPCWIEHLHALNRPGSAPRGADAWSRLETYVQAAMSPPAAMQASRDALAGYLAEAAPNGHALWRLYERVLRCSAGASLPAWPAAAPAIAAVPAVPAEPAEPEREVWAYWQRAFTAPDRLAVDYGNRYRSSYVLVFALAALALSFSTFGAGWILPTAMELICLSGIFLIVRLNVSRHWHERLIGYRLLAELCRKQQALAVFGWSLPVTAATEISSEADGEPDTPPRDLWVAWVFNALVRAAPLPQGAFTGERLDAALGVVRTRLLEGQALYHARRRHDSETAARRFGALGRFFFTATLLMVLVKLVLLMLARSLPGLAALGDDVRLLLGVLPGIAGFFVGIKGYAEWELLASQSERMLRLLRQADAQIARLEMRVPLASQDAGAAILPLTEDMLLDITGWAQLIRVKAVEAS